MRMPILAALAGCTAALALAALINTGLVLAGGDLLVIPGELGIAQVVIFTLVMIIPAAVVLWLMPRWFPLVAMLFAVATIPLAFSEFGSPIGWWLGAMHLVAGACAALLAPRIARSMTARTR